MKFVCLACNRPMELDGLEDRGEGVLAVAYACRGCGQRVAMVTNPGETQVVRSLGVQIGHEWIEPEPMSTVQGNLAGARPLVRGNGDGGPRWSEAAERRLAAAPVFVQAMVRRLYTDWAREQGIDEITPEIMNRAREQLGMTGM
jgi:hypothetical protein